MDIRGKSGPKLTLWAAFSFLQRGVGFKGGSLHDGFGGFDGFGGSEEHLALLCLSHKIQCQETTVTVLTVLAVSAVVAVSVVTATPLKLNPPFP